MVVAIGVCACALLGSLLFVWCRLMVLGLGFGFVLIGDKCSSIMLCVICQQG